MRGSRAPLGDDQVLEGSVDIRVGSAGANRGIHRWDKEDEAGEINPLVQCCNMAARRRRF